VELRVALDLEFLPPWARHSYAGEPTVITIVMKRADLARAAAAWDEAASPFPDGS